MNIIFRIWTMMQIIATMASRSISSELENNEPNMPTTPSSYQPLPATGTPKCHVTETELLGILLRNYSKQARPIKDPSRTVLVQLGLRLFGIKDFVDHDNILIFNGYFTMNWYDELLRWKEMPKYQCIESLIFDADQIWRPDIKMLQGSLLGNPNFLTAGEKIVAASSNGSMFFYVMGEFTVRCELDVHYFPFDEQHCEFIVESWNYPTYMQMLRFIDPPFAKIPHFWTENEMWEITDNATDIINPIYVNDDGVYDRCIFKMILQRKSLYYYIHVIIPSIIITVAEIVTFLLPVEEYIKVHISFTCLLAYSVFENMIIDEMPRSSKVVPLLSMYIDLQMAYIGVIALLGEGVVCVILRQAHANKPAPPGWLLEYTSRVGVIVFSEFDSFIRIFGRKRDLVNNENDQGEENIFDPAIAEKYPKLMIHHGHLPSNYSKLPPPPDQQQTNNDMTSREQWVYIAEVFERCIMWVYVVATIITPCIMFNLPRHSDAAATLRPSKASIIYH